jgi:hypothetical protein
MYNKDAIEYSGTKYDTDSIMQYPLGTCGLKFLGTDEDLAQRAGYSSTDKLEVAHAYPYLGSGQGGTHVQPEYPEAIVHNDCLRENGKDYRGDISFGFRSGETSTYNCEKWTIVDSENVPQNIKQQVGYVKRQVYDRHLKDHNYCRNYEGDDKGPWCLSRESPDGWVNCDIPKCGAVAPVVDCLINTDYFGCDIPNSETTASSALLCQETCKNDNQCDLWSWNINSNRCYLENTSRCQITESRTDDTVAGDRTCSMTAEILNLSKPTVYCLINTDYYGCDIPNNISTASSALLCQGICKDHYECDMWSWNINTNRCYLENTSRCQITESRTVDTVAGDETCSMTQDILNLSW